MNSEKLDGLFIDYSVGAVDENVAELLETLATKDAEIKAQLDQWRSVAALARCARESPRMELPEFPHRQLQTVRHHKLMRTALLWTAATAACLAIGFFAGKISRPDAIVSHPSQTVATLAPPPVATVADFWSVARLRADQANRQRAGRTNSFGSTTWSQLRKNGVGS